MKNILLTAAAFVLLGAGCAPAAPSSPSTSPSVPSDAPAVLNSERIDLSGRGLTSLPKDVLERRDAVELDISDNRIEGALPAEISRLSRLKSLNASGNVMTGVPAEVGRLSELEILNLSDNLLTGLPHEIGNLSKLKILNLRGNEISPTDLEVIRAALPAATVIVE